MQADSRDELLNLLLTTPRELNQLRTTNKLFFRRGIPHFFSWKILQTPCESYFHLNSLQPTRTILQEPVEVWKLHRTRLRDLVDNPYVLLQGENAIPGRLAL